MTDVFPRRNLPGEAEQWGRAHDDRVIALETRLEALSATSSGQNRNTASSLSVLGGQFRDLIGRVSNYDSSATEYEWNSPVNITEVAVGPILSFTLTETRKVRLRASIFIDAQVSTPSGSVAAAYSNTRLTLRLNGVRVGLQEYDDVFMQLPPVTSEFSDVGRRRVSTEFVTTMSPGSYALQGNLLVQIGAATAGAFAGVTRARDASVQVDVLQLVE